MIMMILSRLAFFGFTLFFSTTTWCADAVKGKDVFQKCIACHGADGMGKKSQQAPMLAGQYSWYVVKQLNNIKNKTRSNANTEKMLPFVKNLSSEQIDDVAAYIESLPKK